MKFARSRVAQFQEQDCSLTLREALAEFYAVNTSVLDETAGDYWVLLGTDMKFMEYAEYLNTPEGKKLVKQLGIISIIKALVLGVPLLVKIFRRSRKMSAKWKTRDYEQYLDRPLAEVRREFSLEILSYPA